jgi:predicted Rossmann fold nucleotide-binding protein DprA/Smf involved in DNA uptake
VAELLADGPRATDELVRAAGRPAAEVAAALVELELAGLATQADGVYRASGAA